MLPIFTPNRSLSLALYDQADRTDSLSTYHLAELVKWAARHYAVDTNVYPQSTAADAAASIAATINNNRRFDAK